MDAQLTVPEPLKDMLAYLELDVQQSYREMPGPMEEAILNCLVCGLYYTCDDETVESRYFQCPNRDFFDRLENWRDKS